jgi:flagellar protein FliO/FliZ
MYEKTVVLLQETIDKLNRVTPAPSAAPGMEDQVSKLTYSSGNSFLQLVGLVFLLVIILIAAYYTTKFVGGIKLGQQKNSNFQVIDAYRISSNKVIQIVKIGNKYIVLGIGKDTINFITELTEEEVFIREAHAGEKLPFKQILEKLRINK